MPLLPAHPPLGLQLFCFGLSMICDPIICINSMQLHLEFSRFWPASHFNFTSTETLVGLGDSPKVPQWIPKEP